MQCHRCDAVVYLRAYYRPTVSLLYVCDTTLTCSFLVPVIISRVHAFYWHFVNVQIIYVVYVNAHWLVDF